MVVYKISKNWGRNLFSPSVAKAFRKLQFFFYNCFAPGSNPRVIHYRKPYLKPPDGIAYSEDGGRNGSLSENYTFSPYLTVTEP